MLIFVKQTGHSFPVVTIVLRIVRRLRFFLNRRMMSNSWYPSFPLVRPAHFFHDSVVVLADAVIAVDMMMVLLSY